MAPAIALSFEGRKYLWDGRTYATREDADAASRAYEAERFETRTSADGSSFYVYTRREVRDAPPAGP